MNEYSIELEIGNHLDKYRCLKNNLDQLNPFRSSNVEDKSEIIDQMLNEADIISSLVEQLLGVRNPL